MSYLLFEQPGSEINLFNKRDIINGEGVRNNYKLQESQNKRGS